ncbi:uncharacterized protein LOC130678025 isoform X1 [Microplitis mediator]|uniref:uncharacterized protein LOC130678025 isoform X1 n=1 Tax=Microplitis mediator TaxID=375433 RepID=UPI0025542C25|nr:uncharacterized protein LOC130678025 isoform X1 [Microplitis mediator]
MFNKIIIFICFTFVRAQVDNFNERWIIVNKINFNKCSRYCTDDIQIQDDHLNVLWIENKLIDQGLISTIKETLEYATCETSIKIDCNDSLIESTTQLDVVTKKYEFDNELNFEVNSDTALLQLTLMGNISWFLLQIPLGSQRKKSTDLFLRKNIYTNEYYLLIKNPEPGEWKLRIDKNVNASNNVTMLVINKSTSLSRRIDLPSRIDWQEQDEDESKSRIITQEIYEVDENESNGNKKIERLNELTQLENENDLIRRNVLVDVAYESKLIATPGTVHTILFSVTNSVDFDVLYQYEARSSQYQIIFYPLSNWIAAEQTAFIPVRIIIPPNANEFNINTVSLKVKGNDFGETKSAYIYIQNSTSGIVSSGDPTIEVYFNDNCFGKSSRDRCNLNQWSAEIVIKNDQSGVKNVISEPTGIQPKTNFIAGTKSPVYFYYTSTCCNKIVNLRVIDINQRTFTKTVDVTAWDNLTTGEIIAAGVGTILLLLILIIIIIVCINCIKKRKNADITYTQRYGSRPTP